MEKDAVDFFLEHTTPEERECIEAADRKVLFQRLADNAAEKAQALLEDAKALLQLHIIYEGIAHTIEVPCKL